MKTKSKIEEKKLTKAELEAREKVMKDLKKNKSALVKRYGKDAEAVMYGRATNIAKKMAEAENKNKIKELVRKSLMQETGKKEDITGPKGKPDGKIDSKDYLAKRDAAIKKAKGELKEYQAPEDLVRSLQKQGVKINLQEPYTYKDIKDALKALGLEDKFDNLMPQNYSVNMEFPKDMYTEDIDLGHEDNEPHMIKAELYRIGKYAMELYAIAEELEETGQEIDFPAWWQAMITDAATKMVKAKHYLDFELKEPFVDAFVDKITGEKPHMGEPKLSVSDLDEGLFDRIKSKLKGATAGASQAVKNIGAAVKGDPTSFKSTADASNMAKIGQKTKTLNKEIDDVYKDLNKLFPAEKLDKNPNLKATIDKYKALLNQTKTASINISNQTKSSQPESSKTEPAKTEPATGKTRDEKGRFTSNKTTTPKAEPISNKYEVTNDVYNFNGKDFAVQVDKNTKEKFFKNDDGRIMDISTLEKTSQTKKKTTSVAEKLAKQLKSK
jgi:hypothetical protein